MKIRTLAFAAVAAGLAFTSCSQNKEGKSISEIRNLSTGDSVSYYLGVSLAGQYRQISSQDTTIKGNQGKQEFMEGFLKGMSVMKENSEAYRAGFMMGIQSSGMTDQMKERYGLKINGTILEEGFRYTLRGDSLINVAEAQNNIGVIMQRLEAGAAKKDQEAASKALAAESAKLGGYTKLNDMVMMKTVKAGSGEAFKPGDNIKFSMVVKDMSGNEQKMLSNPAVEGEIGKNLPLDAPYIQAILKMKPGETAEILIPASVCFQGRAAQYGFKNDDIFRITITAERISESVPAEEPTATLAQ